MQNIPFKVSGCDIHPKHSTFLDPKKKFVE